MKLAVTLRRVCGRQVPTPATAARARALAQKMPLAHFPAKQRFNDWSAWDGLASGEARGLPAPTDAVGRLEWEHVYAFAGPSCYGSTPKHIGDAALYFDASCERTATGGASPFDTGALLGAGPRLRPWAAKPLTERQKIFGRYSTELAGWRDHFASWLAYCYSDPDRYIDTSGGRYRAGAPDRSVPAALVRENGERGVGRHGSSRVCDRRAWTWEVRLRGRLSFAHAKIIHVPFDQLQKAAAWTDQVRLLNGGAGPVPRTLPPQVPGSPETLFAHAGALLREWLP